MFGVAVGQESTAALISEVAIGVLQALDREVEAGKMILRFNLEDLVYSAELRAYAVSADLTRYDIDDPPKSLSLLGSSPSPAIACWRS